MASPDDDLLRRLEEVIPNIKWTGQRHVTHLLREARDRIAQMAQELGRKEMARAEAQGRWLTERQRGEDASSKRAAAEAQLRAAEARVRELEGRR